MKFVLICLNGKFVKEYKKSFRKHGSSLISLMLLHKGFVPILNSVGKYLDFPFKSIITRFYMYRMFLDIWNFFLALIYVIFAEFVKHRNKNSLSENINPMCFVCVLSIKPFLMVITPF